MVCVYILLDEGLKEEAKDRGSQSASKSRLVSSFRSFEWDDKRGEQATTPVFYGGGVVLGGGCWLPWVA